MATKTPSVKPNGNGMQTAEDHLDGFKFTLNLRNGNEALTIRTNDEAELETLRGKYKPVIAPDRKKLAYMNIGDPCPNECGGRLEMRNATNRKSGQPYAYLRCENHPECNFVAYVETQPKKEKATA